MRPYVVVPTKFVKCSEALLRVLLAEIDALEWNEPDSARVFFERLPLGSGVPGGMGGGTVQRGVWVHERLRTRHEAIASVLAGERTSIHPDA